MGGFVFYRGASQLDGALVIGIAIVNSGNRKRGSTDQTWIIGDDLQPVVASRTGADSAICGGCGALAVRRQVCAIADGKARTRSARFSTPLPSKPAKDHIRRVRPSGGTSSHARLRYRRPGSWQAQAESVAEKEAQPRFTGAVRPGLVCNEAAGGGCSAGFFIVHTITPLGGWAPSGTRPMPELSPNLPISAFRGVWPVDAAALGAVSNVGRMPRPSP